MEEGNSIEVKVNAFRGVSTPVSISALGITQSQSIETSPNGTYTLSFTKPKGDYSIDVPGLELHYNVKPALIKRNFNNPAVITQNTLEKKFLKAKDAQRYRDYPLAEKLLNEILS